MRRRTFLLTIGLLVAGAPAWAQQSKPVPRIGFVAVGPSTAYKRFLESFKAGLTDLGYVEGRNIIIEPRFAEGVPERLPALLDELLRSDIDLIVSQGPAIHIVSKVVKTVPVVYAFSGDAVSAGFSDSLARPTGNLTGQSYMAVELNAKRLELLKEIMPNATRVALLANPIHAGEHLERAESQRAAATLGINLQYLQVRTAAEMDAAFDAMVREGAEAIVAVPDNLLLLERSRLSEFAARHRLPVISGWAEFARSGGVLTYGPNLTKSVRRLATYVDRVLKGASPADLPIERPSEFELVVNLRTAKAIGLEIPPAVLARADEVIE